jgi:hypothetical protein
MTSVQDLMFKLYEHKVLRLSLSIKSLSAPKKHKVIINAYIVYRKNERCLVKTCNHNMLKVTGNLEEN